MFSVYWYLITLKGTMHLWWGEAHSVKSAENRRTKTHIFGMAFNYYFLKHTFRSSFRVITFLSSTLQGFWKKRSHIQKLKFKRGPDRRPSHVATQMTKKYQVCVLCLCVCETPNCIQTKNSLPFVRPHVVALYAFKMHQTFIKNNEHILLRRSKAVIIK